MHFRSAAVAALLLFTAFAHALAWSDTTRVYPAAEVVVTATRTSLPADDSPSPVQVLTTQDFERSNGSMVADVLRSAQGAVLKEYGSPGQFQSISLRGLPSEHVVVLLNGVRLNSFQNGLVDLSLVPLDGLERIEVVRGGNSALYGADALGGVINLLTRGPAPGCHVRAEAGGGSFLSRRYAVEVSGGGMRAGYSIESGDEDYPFPLQRPGAPDTTLRRANADYFRSVLFLQGFASVGDRTTAQISVQRVVAKRGIPGEAALPFIPNHARQDDDNVQTTAVIRHDAGSGLLLSLNGSFQYGWQVYNDPNPAYPTTSRYRTTMASVAPQVEYTATSVDRIVAGLEYLSGILDGNDFNGLVKRRQWSGFVSNEFRIERESSFLDRVTFICSGRYDEISDVGSALSPKAGINVRLVPIADLRFHASAGTNFHAPTFNDMYYPGFSNPGLKPEHSTSFDGGFSAQSDGFLRHRIDVTFFLVDTRDRIQFDPVQMTPINIGRVRSSGIEMHYGLADYAGTMQLLADASVTDVLKKDRTGVNDPAYDKQLPYVPVGTGSIAFAVQEGPVHAALAQLFTGSRATSVPGAPALPAYSRTDANVTWSMDWDGARVRLRAEVDNIFDVHFEIYQHYPMPGRIMRFSAAVSY